MQYYDKTTGNLQAIRIQERGAWVRAGKGYVWQDENTAARPTYQQVFVPMIHIDKRARLAVKARCKTLTQAQQYYDRTIRCAKQRMLTAAFGAASLNLDSEKE